VTYTMSSSEEAEEADHTVAILQDLRDTPLFQVNIHARTAHTADYTTLFLGAISRIVLISR